MLTRRYWHALMRSISSCSPPALHLPVVFCIFSLMSSVTAEEPLPRPQQAGSARQLPEHRLANTTSLQGVIRDTYGDEIPNVQVDLGNTAGPEKYSVITGAEGIFRLRNVQLGVYRVTLAKEGFNTLVVPRLELLKPELATPELQLQPLNPAAPENVGPSGIPGISETPPAATTFNAPYPSRVGAALDTVRQESPPERVPPDSANFIPEPDRWDIDLPEWRRYEQQHDAPYVRGHRYDPFNRNPVSVKPLRGADGTRPCFGPYKRFQCDPHWKDYLLFNEYYHGDSGMGLGASHQTGWSGLVANLIDEWRR